MVSSLRHGASVLLLFVLLTVFDPSRASFQHFSTDLQWRRQTSSSRRPQKAFVYNTVLNSASSPNAKDEDNQNRGYKFGDLTRGVLGRFQTSVNSLTGKSTYEFGDLTKWVSSQAKEELVKLDQASKERVQQFTQRPNYQFGDITRELIRRFQDGEYNAQDIWLFFRIALLVGKPFIPPVAATLPVKVLMELAEFSVAQSVGEDLTGIFTNEIDQRMKQWITGDKDYRLGDFAKKALTGDKNYQVGDLTKKVIQRYTAKDVYEFGDVTRQLWKKHQESQEKVKAKQSGPPSPDNSSAKASAMGSMDKEAMDEFEEWDRNFLATQRRSNEAQLPSASETDYREWDQRLVQANSNNDDNYSPKSRA